MWKLYGARSVKLMVDEESGKLVSDGKPMYYQVFARRLIDAAKLAEGILTPGHFLVHVEQTKFMDRDAVYTLLSKEMDHPEWTKRKWRAAVRKHETTKSYAHWATDAHMNQMNTLRRLHGDDSVPDEGEIIPPDVMDEVFGGYQLDPGTDNAHDDRNNYLRAAMHSKRPQRVI